MGEFGIGQSVPRFEDPRLLRGQGRFINDVNLPRQAHAYVLRSPHAHARASASIDTAAAAAAPGVLAVFTGDDVAADGLGTTDDVAQAQAARRLADVRAGAPRARARARALRRRPGRAGRRRDPRAGEGRRRAGRDRLRSAALGHRDGRGNDAGSAPRLGRMPRQRLQRVRDGRPGGDRCRLRARGARRTADATSSPACTPSSSSRAGRSAITTRARIATRSMPTFQYPHRVRNVLAVDIFRIPETSIRVVAGDVGGSFGAKGWAYMEHRLVLWAAKKLGRPVKWACERSEAILADEHARDRISEAELALDARRQVPRPARADDRERRRLHLVGAQPARHLQPHRHVRRHVYDPGRACASALRPDQLESDCALPRQRAARVDVRDRASHRRCGARATV